MIKDGIPQNLIKIIGQPYLESISKKIPPLGQNLLIVGQPIKKYFGKKLGYDEVDFKKICLKAIKKKNEYILYTKHPEEIDRNIQLNYKFISRKGKGFNDVANSHTVLAVFSMQMIIGYLLCRKVASVQPKVLKFDPSPLSRWGLVPMLNNIDEIKKFISKDSFIKKKSTLKMLSKYRFNQLGITGSIKRFQRFLKKYSYQHQKK